MFLGQCFWDKLKKPFIYVFCFLGRAHPALVIAFLLTAFFVGFLIVYVVPKVNGWIAQVPQVATISQNKFAQLLIVGVVVILGLHVFLAVVKKEL